MLDGMVWSLETLEVRMGRLDSSRPPSIEDSSCGHPRPPSIVDASRGHARPPSNAGASRGRCHPPSIDDTSDL